MRNLLYGGLCAAVLVSAACGAKTQNNEIVAAVDKEVVAFHGKFNQGQIGALYDQGSPRMHAAVPRPKFVGFVGRVRQTLGRTTESRFQGYRINLPEAPGLVLISYQTRFEKGAGVETFGYTISDAPKLAAYYINSPLIPQ